MPRLRHLIIWLLILWLPAQALAGQSRLCPHVADQQQTPSSEHHAHHQHGHHQHGHHAHHPAPSGPEDPACPHCEPQHAEADSLLERTMPMADSCDQCNCCQLGGAYAALGPIITAIPRFRDHWIAPPASNIYSHISHPLQRPPQNAA